ncbi:MAG TPA: FeoA family protein [Polyangiaceae bacterium]|nr:FeoA family protein [Polyangiaceae bacterium]
MTLADATVGQLVMIDGIGGERAFRRRLMELGLVPGTRLQLIGRAPLGDPLELLVRGCSLSIRRAEAASVEVRLAGEPRAERAIPLARSALAGARSSQ